MGLFINILNKMHYRLTAFCIASVILIVLAGWFVSYSSAKSPDSLFITITGKQIELKSLRGQPVIVTFWATDCPSCVQEIPEWIRLYQQYHAKGLEIIAINRYYDPPSHVVEMVQLKQIPYDVVLDLNGQHAEKFGNVQLTPTTFLLATNGTIVFSKIGLLDFANLSIEIEKLLKG